MEEKTIYDRLAAAQANMKNPEMNGFNPRFKSRYATLADVLNVVRPALNAEGLFFAQSICKGEDGHYLATEVRAGDRGVTLDRRPVSLTGNSQADGSAETYAKRYAACSVFGIVGEEDDDGNAAVDVQGQQATTDQLNAFYEAVKAFADITGRTPDEVKTAVEKTESMQRLHWDKRQGGMTEDQCITATGVLNAWIKAKKD